MKLTFIFAVVILVLAIAQTWSEAEAAKKLKPGKDGDSGGSLSDIIDQFPTVPPNKPGKKPRGLPLLPGAAEAPSSAGKSKRSV